MQFEIVVARRAFGCLHSQRLSVRHLLLLSCTHFNVVLCARGAMQLQVFLFFFAESQVRRDGLNKGTTNEQDSAQAIVSLSTRDGIVAFGL